MDWETKLKRATDRLRERELEFLGLQNQGTRKVLRIVGKFQEQVLDIMDQGLSNLGILDPDDVIKWEGAPGNAVARSIIQSVEDLGIGPMTQDLQEWADEFLPHAYEEGIGSARDWDGYMSGSRPVPYLFDDQDALLLRSSLEQSYRFAGEVSVESTQYFRAVWSRSVAERWTRKQLIDQVVQDEKLTSIVDARGRRISVQTRAEMFADWHLTETQNLAERLQGQKTYGTDGFYIWQGVIDIHTSEITLRRAGLIQSWSDWEMEGGNVFDGTGIPPLWPRCRCKLRAVSPIWFSGKEWDRAMSGERMLVGKDKSIQGRRLREIERQKAA